MNDFETLAQKTKDCYSLKSGFLFWKFLGSQTASCDHICQKGMILHILVRDGELLVRCDGVQRRLQGGSFANFIAIDDFELLSSSPDAGAYIMIFTEDFTKELTKNNPPLPVSYVVQVRQHPIISLSRASYSLFSMRMDTLWEACRDEGNVYREEIVKHACMMLLLDIGNKFICQNGTEYEEKKMSRSQKIFIEYTRLLQEKVCTEHSVNYYASELCITPQYLNRMVRSYTGKSAYDWICNNLVGEISRRLAESSDSMQTIAEDLNFSDQASMTKFFKRLTGYTPSEYKRSVALSVA